MTDNSAQSQPSPTSVPSPVTKAQPSAAHLAASPFLPGGLGSLMMGAGYAYMADYVLSLDDGPDHEPTEFERVLLEDFLNGLISDETFFGPIRRVLLQAAAAQGMFAALREIEVLFQYEYPVPLRAESIARAAIAKALGPSAQDTTERPDRTREEP